MPNDWYQVIISSIHSFRVQYRKKCFHRNVFTFGLYNPNILKQPYPFAIMDSNKASQELRSMSKTSLENDIFYSKNITFRNHMMTYHIF